MHISITFICKDLCQRNTLLTSRCLSRQWIKSIKASNGDHSLGKKGKIAVMSLEVETILLQPLLPTQYPFSPSFLLIDFVHTGNIATKNTFNLSCRYGGHVPVLVNETPRSFLQMLCIITKTRFFYSLFFSSSLCLNCGVFFF